jgi:hypothetical protein
MLAANKCFNQCFQTIFFDACIINYSDLANIVAWIYAYSHMLFSVIPTSNSDTTAGSIAARLVSISASGLVLTNGCSVLHFCAASLTSASRLRPRVASASNGDVAAFMHYFLSAYYLLRVMFVMLDVVIKTILNLLD